MKIALVITVKNEERILRNNILYHHCIGVDKFFIYFDGTSDKGKESISNLPFVEITNSVPYLEYEDYRFLDKFTNQAMKHHTARQCLNTYHASKQAEKSGYDWLISVDADELIATDKNDISNLKLFLKNIDIQFDAVQFKVLEVLQAKVHYEQVFREETRFKTTRNFKRYSENIFKTFYNPISRRSEKYVYWYGHHTGKMAIRLHRELIPYNPHKFVRIDNNKIKTVSKGLLLHYHAYDADDFIKKYRNFKDRPKFFLSGNKVEDLKLLFIEVVNRSNFTQEELENYFKNYLMFNKREIRNLLRNKVYYFFSRKKPVLMTITGVSKTFEKLNS